MADGVESRLSRRSALRGVAAVCAAVGGSVLAACGPSTSAGNGSQTTGVLPIPQSGVTQLTFEADPQGSVSMSKTNTAIMQEFVDKNFNTNPYYKGLWATVLTSARDGSTQVTDTIAGKGFADIMSMCCSDIPTLERGGYALPLDSLLKTDNISYDNWSKGHIAADSFLGKLYGLPSYDGSQVIFYNQGILDTLGVAYPDSTWTWTEAADIWTKASGKNKDGTTRYGVSLYWSGEYEMLNWWMQGWGAQEMNATQDKALFNSNNAIQCLSWCADLFSAHVAMNRGGINNMTNDSAVFLMTHPDKILTAAEQLGNNVKWNILPNPVWPAGKACFETIDCYMLNSAVKDVSKAWELMKWINLGTPQGNSYDYAWPKFQIQIELITPSLVNLWSYWLTTIKAAAPPLKDKDLQWYADAAQKGYAYPTIFFRYDPATGNGTDNIINTWIGEILGGKVSAAQGLNQAVSQINALQVAAAASEAKQAAVTKEFPTNGPTMAPVPYGI